MSTVEWPPARAARTNGRSRNARSLFISGAMTWARAGVGELLVPGPETPQDGVGDGGGDPGPEGGLGQQPGQVGQGRDARPGRAG